MENFIEKGQHDCWIWVGPNKSAPNKTAEMACKNDLCCNPQHVIVNKDPVGSATKNLPVTGAGDQATILKLQQICEQNGIIVDKRWGLEKLKEAIKKSKEEG